MNRSRFWFLVAVGIFLSGAYLIISRINVDNRRIQATEVAKVAATTTAIVEKTEGAIDSDEIRKESVDWPTTFTDDFNINAKGWSTGYLNNDHFSGEQSIDSSRYIWDFTSKQDFWWGNIPNGPSTRDFKLTVHANLQSGTDQGYYGVAFRLQNWENFYSFWITESGQYSFQVKDQNEWRILIDWTDTEGVRSNEKNEITVIGRGDYFVFMINNKIVDKYYDDRHSRGQMGLIAWIENPNVSATFLFHDFKIQVPPTNDNE